MMYNWKEWMKAAGIRALRTFGEAALAYIGTGAMVLGDVNWIGVLSAGTLGALTSLLLALAGLPEVEAESKLRKRGKDGNGFREDPENVY